jgi:hypothetical protein
VFSPSVLATFWSPKAAVLLVAGAYGLSRLPAVLRSSLRPVVAAGLTFVAVAALSTLLSPRPVEATFGIYNWGTGLVFVLCLLGVFALGVAAGDSPRLRSALVAGCALSGAAALLQAAGVMPLDVLDAEGRAIGLAGDAVQLGTVACIGLALCAWHATTAPPWLLGVVGFTATVQASGSRAALVVAIVVTVAIGIRRAPRRLPPLVAAATVGFVLGNALASSSGAVVTATSRGLDESTLTVAGGSGMRVRAEVWLSSRHAVIDRPVLGAGPGRFRAATSPFRTQGIVDAEGPGLLYADGHNLAVEYLVTTGVLGVLALAAWLVLALRRARGPMLTVVLTVLAVMVVQPQSVSTTPLLFLSLGAAIALPLTGTPRRAQRIATPALTVVGASLAVVLLVGDAALLDARRDFDLDAARRADVLLRPWAEPAAARATIHDFRAIDADDDDARARERAAVRRWRRIAVDRDPTRPSLWLALAADQREDGLDEEAAASEVQARRLDPVAPPRATDR